MLLSDTAVTRPVFATVVSLLLIIFGVASFQLLPLREYPDIDPPVIAIETYYPGAAANVIETQITEVIEQRISGIEGIEFIESRSTDGESEITVRFNINRNIDGAANDVRDRVSGILADLPDEADPPEITKVDGNQDVIVWWNLISDHLTVPELTDHAERYLVDRFSVLDGVARIRVGGAQSYAMRVWLDRNAMAARELTVADVERALRAENIELPAGHIESQTRILTVWVEREFRTADDFNRMVIARGDDGHMIRLGDIARVERGTVEDRTFFRGNRVPMVGLGIVRQSTANTLEVARASRELVERINPTLPEGMEIRPSFDSSVFVDGAIREVYRTLLIALGMVVLVIFLFLGSLRATVVPAVTVPVAVTSTFIALAIFGFTVNLLTLLALVLAIGLVVDDAIIVLENIRRRIDDLGETPLVASFYGTRQVGFAVISTTLTLVSVFVPIAFLQGDVGRLFSEFALTLAAAVVFSSFVALTLSPVLASKLLRQQSGRDLLSRTMGRAVIHARRIYAWILRHIVLRFRFLTLLLMGGIVAACFWLFEQLPSEYTPREDRGAFFVVVTGPEGASHEYMKNYMDEIEDRMMPLVDNGEITRLLVRSPQVFENFAVFNTGIVISVLNDWGVRRSGWEIMADVQERLSDLTGVRISTTMRQGFGAGLQRPVQFVIGGGESYEQLAEWRDILLEQIEQTNPGLQGIDWDYKETQPQLGIEIDYDRAADLGVTVENIGRTLETMLGSRRVTTYIDAGEEYDVIVEGERDTQRTPASLENIYVRSDRGGALIPLSNLVTLTEFAGSTSLNRYNRLRAITIEAGLADHLILGDALRYLENLVAEHLPETVVIDYKGQSLDYQTAGQELMFVFLLGIVVVFLVLSAQFESFVHPLVIIFGVPLAIAGGLFGLWLTGNSLNLYSQIGLVMLVGLAAKNGILIVEFANQLRDQGLAFDDALVEAATIRLRPIVMTGITTAAGVVPLVLAFGAGAETRIVIGTVVMFGVIASTFLTLIAIPVLYSLFARHTGSPGDVQRRLEREDPRSGAAASPDRPV